MVQPDPSHPLAGPFWQAAREQRLEMSWCANCDAAVWYPRPACPDCDGALHWRALSGSATLLSWTVVGKSLNPDFGAPYITALVVPVEAPGARLVTRLVDCEPGDLECDMPLRLCFRMLQPRQGEPFMAPVFTPA